MDPNVSTEVPSEYTNSPLGETMNLSVKFYTFGSLAIVISLAIGFGVYLVFFKKRHLAKKAIRLEKEVCFLISFYRVSTDASNRIGTWRMGSYRNPDITLSVKCPKNEITDRRQLVDLKNSVNSSSSLRFLTPLNQV
jgi:hypothetical protein